MLDLNQGTVKTKDELEAMIGEEFLELAYGDVADLEGFVPKPSGMYGFTVTGCSLEKLGAEEKLAIQLELSVTEVVELLDEADAEEVGELPAKYTESFFLTGAKIGGRAFVTMTRQLAEEQEWASLSEAVAGIVGFSGQGMIIKRQWKDKTTDEIKHGNQIDGKTVTWS